MYFVNTCTCKCTSIQIINYMLLKLPVYIQFKFAKYRNLNKHLYYPLKSPNLISSQDFSYIDISETVNL